MSHNGKRRRGGDENNNDRPSKRSKVLDAQEVASDFSVDIPHSPTAGPSFAPYLSAPSGIPSSAIPDVPAFSFVPDDLGMFQEQQQNSVVPDRNEGQFREGRDFDLEIILGYDDFRLHVPRHYPIQDVNYYQPSDPLSHLLVAYGQLFRDNYGNLVRIRPRQELVPTLEVIDNEFVYTSEQQASAENQSQASPPRKIATQAVTQQASRNNQNSAPINSAATRTMKPPVGPRRSTRQPTMSQQSGPSKAPHQTKFVSKQGPRINPYGPGGLFAQEFSQTPKLAKIYLDPDRLAKAILSSRPEAPPAERPSPSVRQLGQKKARQTRADGATHAAPSAQAAVAGPSTHPVVPGPSTHRAVPGPSARSAVPRPSTNPAIPGPSTHSAVPGPSTNPAIPGSSAQVAIPGSITRPAVSGSSVQSTVPRSNTKRPSRKGKERA